MVCLHTTFQMPLSNGSLVTGIETEVKYTFHAAMLFFRTTESDLIKCCIFSIISVHQIKVVLYIDITSTSEVRGTSILLLLVVGI